MAPPKRPRREPTDRIDQIRLYVAWPEQETYEVLRPMVLFGQTAAARAEETGIADRTLERKADRFDAEGMASLFADTTPSPQDRRFLPADIRHRILSLKAEYPVFRPHEIAAICRRRDDCRVSHKTVQRVLASNPLPVVQRRYPPYAQMPDGAQRRLAIMHLYFDGWNIKSIAGYLETTRTRVYETLYRFFRDEFAGMADQSRAPKEPARKVDFKAMAAVRRLQANPELGEFRIHAALAQLGIHLSPRTCGRILAQNRALGLPSPAVRSPHEPRTMPYAATYRHEYWSVDVRYIEDHQLEQRKPVYVISVLENYSRSLLASILSPRQDLTAFLVVLRLALLEHGCPTAIVSDSGSIFKAKLVLQLYERLGIERCHIESGQPWQNYIETHFNIMRRMLDYDLARAPTWEAMRAAHARFFHDYNVQPHFAHLGRADGKRSPQAVLGWVHGIWCEPAELDRLFTLRVARRFDRHGYLRFRRWRIYGERGLPGERGAAWLFGEVLTITYQDETLAQYQVAYEPDGRHLKAVTGARLYPHRYPSSQLFLPGLGLDLWQLAHRLPPRHTRRKRVASGVQGTFFPA
jgi:transposase InsO family protein